MNLKDNTLTRLFDMVVVFMEKIILWSRWHLPTYIDCQASP